jgi:hypothetical protein
MTYMTKEIPRSERPESLPVEMSLIFLENPESPNVKSVPKSFENEKYSSKYCRMVEVRLEFGDVLILKVLYVALFIQTE